MSQPAMSADALYVQVFGDTLACEERRPASFVAGAVDAASARAAWQHGEGLLRALAVVEDSRGEEGEEHTPADLAMHRIEAKLDLLTAVVAALVRSRETQDPSRALQWSARGARIDAIADAADAGARGMFRVQPADWLPESLSLPATVQSRDGDRLWLRFDPMPPALAAALERHLFRIHRRAIAELRRPRAES
jgi:hypothetical protein